MVLIMFPSHALSKNDHSSSGVPNTQSELPHDALLPLSNRQSLVEEEGTVFPSPPPIAAPTPLMVVSAPAAALLLLAAAIVAAAAEALAVRAVGGAAVLAGATGSRAHAVLAAAVEAVAL